MTTKMSSKNLPEMAYEVYLCLRALAEAVVAAAAAAAASVAVDATADGDVDEAVAAAAACRLYGWSQADSGGQWQPPASA